MSVLARNNVNVIGQGPSAIMFAHGYGCDQTMWRFLLPAFRERFSLVLFDHVGAGKSDFASYNREKYGTLRGYADDIIEICTELGLSRPVFVGHSVAAMMGVLAAAQVPSLFEAMVLIGPSPCYLNDGDYEGGFTREQIEELLDSMDDNYLGWSTSMAPVIMGNGERPELSEELANSFCRTDPAIARHFARTLFLADNRADLQGVDVRSLILQCACDPIAPCRVGEFTHRQLRNSQLVYMKATGHCPHLSAPAETIAAMRNFLGS